MGSDDDDQCFSCFRIALKRWEKYRRNTLVEGPLFKVRVGWYKDRKQESKVISGILQKESKRNRIWKPKQPSQR